VLSLYRPGATIASKQELEKVRMDLLALQEVSSLATGTLEKNCAIFYSCKPVRHVLGVGFYDNSRLFPNILRLNPLIIDCQIRVHAKFRNYSNINAHAPTEDKHYEEKHKFYLELETVYSQCPKHDIKIVPGDFNAKVGKEGTNYPHAGRNGLHEVCNGNGNQLV